MLEQQIYRGPNLYGSKPMLRFMLGLGELEAYPTTRLPGFTEQLVALIPSLQDRRCSYGVPGGLVRRMEEVIWLGHVTEQVALELQVLTGTVTYGKTRGVRGRPGFYNVIYRYVEEQRSRGAGRSARGHL